MAFCENELVILSKQDFIRNNWQAGKDKVAGKEFQMGKKKTPPFPKIRNSRTWERGFERKFVTYVASQVTNPLLSNRIYYLLTWYDTKAREHKKKYNIFRTIGYILPTLVTILSVFAAAFNQISTYSTLATAVISALITILNHIMDHKRYYENWIRYRGAEEDLKGECMKFLSRCSEPYTGEHTQEELERSFAAKIENIANDEHSSWENLANDSHQNGQADGGNRPTGQGTPGSGSGPTGQSTPGSGSGATGQGTPVEGNGSNERGADNEGNGFNGQSASNSAK